MFLFFIEDTGLRVVHIWIPGNGDLQRPHWRALPGGVSRWDQSLPGSWVLLSVPEAVVKKDKKMAQAEPCTITTLHRVTDPLGKIESAIVIVQNDSSDQFHLKAWEVPLLEDSMLAERKRRCP